MLHRNMLAHIDIMQSNATQFFIIASIINAEWNCLPNKQRCLVTRAELFHRSALQTADKVLGYSVRWTILLLPSSAAC